MLFFRRKRLFIILIGFIILVGSIGFSLRDREELTTVEEFLHDAVGWFQGVVHQPVEFTTTLVSNINELKHIYEENQVLKTRLSQYNLLLHEVKELRKENDELYSVLGKTESESLNEFIPIQASVIARSKEQWFKMITINKGEQDGVETNMAVITGEGMVGKIYSSSQFTSSVLLLNGFDRSNRISVVVDAEETDKDPTGFIVGYDEEAETLLLELDEYDVEVSEGELVVSSGLGGVFPKGLEIGTIEEVAPDKYGLTKVAHVSPSADLYNFGHVIVVDRQATIPSEVESEPEEGEE
ncbi:rod shape-determining protein MreC [Aquibacillus koreensis]|uniref:Cell shape-determining protein MreC n=1 Tax=Aquibacillus koreensis TaxID=279446 RepID=A0A9X4AGY7_9BACI|nr:rod shape-determining protein MreC [Aquibacillus koreensis]MCT2537955.1 rod shape-determining protein MreC [Aquibacillus koreensis]MDC3419154.1 rod shape-determining protein MreC [Aquibacillus koreensis]